MPLYILGSSLFGARLAAQLGLPFAFASHFAPNALQDAVAIYRREFKPSEQLDAPHVIAGVNVIAADSASEAQETFRDTLRARVSLFFGGGRQFTDDEADMILDSPQGQHVCPDDEIFGGRYAGRRDGLPGRIRQACRRRRAHRCSPEHRDRGEAPVGGAAGPSRRARPRLAR